MVVGQQIERVGVQHQRLRPLYRFAQQAAGRFLQTQAGADGEHVGVGQGGGVIQRGDHQFRRHRIHGQPSIQRADMDFAGAAGRALRPLSSAAPSMPGAPPITQTVPNKPLWLLRGRSSARAFGWLMQPSAGGISRGGQSSSSSSTLPARSAPAALNRPGFWHRKVRVWLAWIEVLAGTPE